MVSGGDDGGTDLHFSPKQEQKPRITGTVFSAKLTKSAQERKEGQKDRRKDVDGRKDVEGRKEGGKGGGMQRRRMWKEGRNDINKVTRKSGRERRTGIGVEVMRKGRREGRAKNEGSRMEVWVRGDGVMK
jgi:hypothetical protein